MKDYICYCYFYNYGYMVETSENTIKKDKDKFFEKLTDLYYCFCEPNKPPNQKEKKTAKEMDLKIKKKIKSVKDFIIDMGYGDFIITMGLNYEKLDKYQKEEALSLELDYDIFKNFGIKVLNKYIEDCKKLLPVEIHICFNDIMFVRYTHIESDSKITINNFIRLIRNYFILEICQSSFKDFRNEKIYNNIRESIIKIYPEIKEKYGMNRKLEYLLSFFVSDTDYNYDETNEILNKYYKRKNNNYINDKNKKE